MPELKTFYFTFGCGFPLAEYVQVVKAPNESVARCGMFRYYHDYVRDLFKSHEMKWTEPFEKWIGKALREDGRCMVELNDGCCVSCVLYHDDAKNIKE